MPMFVLSLPLHLCLARSCDGSTWGGTSGGRMSVRRPGLGVDLAIGESRNVWELGVLEGAGCLAPSGSFAIFLVGRNVEEDEEDEVGGD